MPATQCSYKNNGVRCKNKTTNPSGRCYHHSTPPINNKKGKGTVKTNQPQKVTTTTTNTNSPLWIVGVVLGVLLIAVIVFLGFIAFRPAVTPQEVPFAPVATEALAATEAPAAPAAGTACHVIHDYNLDPSMIEVATHSETGYFIHVEYWIEGQPERETILPGNRYSLTTSLRGHVWEYNGCVYEQVYDQVLQHIDRRLAQKANNAGYVDWESTGFFEPVQ